MIESESTNTAGIIPSVPSESSSARPVTNSLASLAYEGRRSSRRRTYSMIGAPALVLRLYRRYL